MDWADEITAKIDLQMQATWNVAPIAAAIRQAMADGRKMGMEQAAGMVSDDEFWTDGGCTWSVFLSDKYQEAVRTAIESEPAPPLQRLEG